MTFRVWLPETEVEAFPDVETLFGAHVLVVDDHEDMLQIVTTTLRGAGAVLSMPGRSGFDLARAIRARATSAGGVIPILALTAMTGDDVRDEALDAGIDLVVHKPILAAALVRAVAMMARRQAGDAVG